MPNLRNVYPLLLAPLMALAGCVSTGKQNIENPADASFAARAEAVFKRQNNLTSQLMMLLPDEPDEGEGYDTLLQGEEQMQEACEALNDYAQQVGDGEDPGIFSGAQAAAAIQSCDSAAQQLETLLQKRTATHHD